MAASSRKTRQTQWNRYFEFCGIYGLHPLPSSESTVALYVAYLFDRLEFKSIENYVFALVALHHKHDMDPPDLSHYCVKEALAGAKRQKRASPNRRKPVTVDHLEIIHRNLNIVPKNLRKTFWAACLVAFFTLLRAGNLFKSENSSTALRVKDLTESSIGYTALVKVLKTAKHRGEKLTLPIPKLTHSPDFCPVRAISRMIKSVGHRSSAPLFSYKTDAGSTHPTVEKFNNILKITLRHAGFSTKLFSAHSFRRGAATTAAGLALDPLALKAQGNWKSDVYLQYISRDSDFRLSFVQSLASAFPSRRS